MGVCALALAVLALCGVFQPGVKPPSAALVAAAEGLDELFIEADFDPGAATLTVFQRLTLTNREGEAREAAALRTWPNAFQSAETSPCASEELYDGCYPNGFSAGSLVMSEALLSREQEGGAEGVPAPDSPSPTPVAYRYQDAAKTLLLLPVPGGWQPGETIALTLRYTVHIPRAAYRFGENDGLWALGNCFAIPAVWESGAYRADAYASVGDPFVSDCANYSVAITAPEGFWCAGSAQPTRQNVGAGRVRSSFDLPAARDFALVVSNRFQAASAMEGNVLVTAFATDTASAREALGYARRALRCFGERYGAYPYQSFTLAEINFPMGGMEYPGMAMIASNQLRTGGRELEYVVAHETAHQWWYAVVGSDPVQQSWQDEALCEYSLLSYVESAYGRAARDELEQTRVEYALRVTVPRGVTPGAPLDAFSSMSEYALVVYERGAAMLCALNRAMSGGLDAFLAAYYRRYAFARASRADFEALLAAETGEDYAPLITDYLDTAILN